MPNSDITQSKIRIPEIKRNLEKNIPPQFKSAPWKALKQRGKDIITEEHVLDCYFCAYSERHEFCANAVIQKIPKEILKSPFYLIDWGCGQGVGTLTLCNYLERLCFLSNLSGVCLIDPSKLASSRAQKFISTWTHKLKVFANFFHEDLPFNFEHKEYPILHIFSNILDLDTIDFRNLAEKIINIGHEHNYFVISSPSYQRGRDNIKYFLEFFSHYTVIDETNTYSLQEELPYNYFSMLIKLSNEHKINSTHEQPIRILNSALQKFLDKNYSIHLNPFNLEKNSFSQKSIDFLLIHKGYGAIFINTINEKLDLNSLKKEIEQIQNQRDDLVKNKIPSLAIAEKIDRKNYAIITRCLYLHKNSIEEINKFKKELKDDKKYRYCELLSYDSLTELDTKLQIRSKRFTPKIYQEINSIISNEIHFKEEGKKFVFKGNRKTLIESKEGARQKIKGFAGSGKTLLLTHRAVNAYKRTKGNILILTYNITICNYIKQKMLDINDDFDLGCFIITNYHKFFISNYKQLYKDDSRSSVKFNDDAFYSDKSIFENYKDKIPKYDAIFIDEAQDFKSEWFDILLEYFASDKAEFVVFADEKQNIYNRISDETKLPMTPIPGRWNELKQSYRLHNKIIELAVDFQKNFGDKYNKDSLSDVKNEQGSLLVPMMEYEVIGIVHYRELAQNIMNKIEKNHIKNQTIGVLLFTHNAVQKVDYFLRNTFKVQTNSMCISKEEKDAYDKSEDQYKNEKRDMDSLKRTKKENFQISNNAINISTIHSFKGWEVENLFIILGAHKQDYDNEEIIKSVKSELIYTAITRCKERLFIISMDTSYFHEYFSNSPLLK